MAVAASTIQQLNCVAERALLHFQVMTCLKSLMPYRIRHSSEMSSHSCALHTPTQVHLYTLRPEPQYVFGVLGNATRGMWNEYDMYFGQEGVDGAFADAPGVLKTYMDSKVSN